MATGLKNKLSMIYNFMVSFAKFVVQILLKFVVQTLFKKTPRDKAWKNKDMDQSNVPKRSGLCWHKFRFFS